MNHSNSKLIDTTVDAVGVFHVQAEDPLPQHQAVKTCQLKPWQPGDMGGLGLPDNPPPPGGWKH